MKGRFFFPLLVGCLTLVGGLLFWATAPVLIGWHPELVTSGSMGPALSAGDIVLTVPVPEPNGLRPGQIISVTDPTKPGGGYLHRLVRHDPDGRLVTKGDANSTPDFPPVAGRRVTGQARYAVRYIGLPALWLHQHDTTAAAASVGIAGAGLVLGWFSLKRRRAKHRTPSAAPAWAPAVAGPLALLVILPLLVGGRASAVFTGQTASNSSLTTASLDGWLPSVVTASRSSPTTCLVSWTENGSAPAGLTYDVTDGLGTTRDTAVSGTSTTITVPATPVTPTVLARSGTWLSASVASGQVCPWPAPDAPVVSLAASDGALVATWQAPADNGSAITGYTATINPGAASCTLAPATRTCPFGALTNGTQYTVSVTATNSLGTSVAGTAVGYPYPSTVLTNGATALWLDGADASTLVASSACTGGAATTSVGCWKDKSANANDAVQSTGSTQPAVSSLNGLSTPIFDGVDDNLVLDPAKLPTGATPSTVFVVAALDEVDPTASAQRSIVAWGAAANGQARSVTKASHSFSASLDTWGSAGAPTLPFDTYNGTLVDGAITSTGTSASVNGSPSYSVVEAHNTGSAEAWVGAGVGGGAQWQGRVAEVIVLSSTVTAAQSRQVEEYLALKWGLVVVPRAPTGLAVVPGDTTATLSWTSPSWDGGSPVTAYTTKAVPSAGGLPTRLCNGATPCNFTGLTDGVTYTFTTTAFNSVGASVASGSVTTVPYPALLTSAGSQLWLDGRDIDGNGIAAGTGENCDTATTCASLANAVPRWVDRSGRGHDAVQPTGAMQPTFAAVAGTVGFTGNGYLTAPNIGVGPDATVFVVGHSTVTPFVNSGWMFGSRAANGYVLNPKNGLVVSTFFGIRSTTVATTSTASAGGGVFANPNVWDGWISGSGPTTLNQAVGGVVGATVSDAASTRVAASMPFYVGADGAAGQRGSFVYNEVIAFNSALSVVDRRTIQEYVARKWGVPITPGFSVSPSAAPGVSTATVSWTAPVWNGGLSVTSYTVTPSGAGTCTWTSGTTASCTGLTHLASYTFDVKAKNSVGFGPTVTTASVTP